jgi:prophage regulatory protein
MAIQILRPSAVMAASGYSKSTLYALVARGLWTKPIKLGKHASGWPDYECDIQTAARISGKSEEEIRELVHRLHAERTANREVRK